MVRCDAVRDLLLDYLEGEAPLLPRRRVEAHLRACPACAAELASLRAIRGLVASAPAPAPGAEFWREFEGEVRRRIAALPPRHPSPWLRLRAWLGRLTFLQPAPALGAAAALGILLAAGLAQSPPPAERSPIELAAGGEALGIGLDLDVLADLDVLECLGEMDLFEALPPLADAAGEGAAARMG
jgi:anti-sigma factor RsiW